MPRSAAMAPEYGKKRFAFRRLRVRLCVVRSGASAESENQQHPATPRIERNEIAPTMLLQPDKVERIRTIAVLALSVACPLVGAARGGGVVEYQRLNAGDGETPDQFGASVDTLDGRMIIGAKYGNFDFIFDCGAAYVWKRTGPTEWEEEAKLNAPDAASDDVFGIATALGDGFALVGAYFDDITAGNDRAGSVYGFDRAMDGTWSFHEKFFAPGATGGELFGYSIAIDGDAAIIGAPAIGGVPGAAHVYRRGMRGMRGMAGGWVLEQSLAATDPMGNDFFGWSVDLDGDRAIVGAYNNDSTLGAAYVFTRDAMSGVWDPGLKVTADSRLAGERFGWSVSMSGDAILVGATQELTVGTGAAYVFRSDGLGGWIQEDRLVGAEADAKDQVGRSVTISGDHALVGAPEHGMFPTVGDQGSVYVFRRTGGGWSQTQRIRAGDGQGDDQFGITLALDKGLLLVGARSDDDFGFNSGSAYVFDTHDAFCGADLNDDLVIDTADLGLLISGFGGADPGIDINGDGIVDTADLGLLISSFGTNCD
jgi:hypothetical protein